MEKINYNPGDKVRITKNQGGFPIGTICRIKKLTTLLSGGCREYFVTDDHQTWYQNEEGFELVKTASSYYMVIVEGKSTPMKECNKYDTAKQEAERLCAKEQLPVQIVSVTVVNRCTPQVAWSREHVAEGQ